VSTAAVSNQTPPLQGYDVLGTDASALESLDRWGNAQDRAELDRLGLLAGSAECQSWATQADANPPELRAFSPAGDRIDEVEFHPAWHRLLEVAVGHGLTAEPWTRPPGSGAHLRRATGFYLWSQLEAGHLCPVSMTYAAVPALAAQPELAAVWTPALASRHYDFGLRPLADKAGALAGMGMTEKQGGSDVRANTTTATASPGPLVGGENYRLEGHKWFCSAPMSDLFLVLAQAPGGLTCLAVPRVLPDGSRNPFALQRLKDKLGNRSNASSELELHGTWAVRVGDEGRGVRTIIDMVGATRLDCVLGSAATMRQALVRAVHHCRHRHAFGAALVDQPLMRNVLMDLALESEAATLLGLRLAHAIDTGETAFARIAVALGKYWVCKRTAPLVAEALECLGGNGYIEENGLARLYREAPLNSIWEGSGNVNALDLLRALGRQPEAVATLQKELDAARGSHAGLDLFLDALTRDVQRLAGDEHAAFAARGLVERLALGLQASLLVRHAPAYVADPFVSTRIERRHGQTFGTIGAAAVRSHAGPVLERALPTAE
jgi:putative acyl-CoA dehydrogenase